MDSDIDVYLTIKAAIRRVVGLGLCGYCQATDQAVLAPEATIETCVFDECAVVAGAEIFTATVTST